MLVTIDYYTRWTNSKTNMQMKEKDVQKLMLCNILSVWHILDIDY